MYDIHAMKTELDPEVFHYLLFIHAFTCSDTTSRIFNVGKQTVFGNLKDPTIINAAENFTTPGLDKNLICEHGFKGYGYCLWWKTERQLNAIAIQCAR